MSRIALALLILAAAAALAIPTAGASPGTSRGVHAVVVAKDVTSRTATVRLLDGSLRVVRLHRLRQARVGSTIVLRRSVLRSSRAAGAASDEHEVKGELTSLSPLKVAGAAGSLSCAVPSGVALDGFAVGQTVEMTCDLVDRVWTLRTLEHDDDHRAGSSGRDDDHDDDDHDDHDGGDDDDSRGNGED